MIKQCLRPRLVLYAVAASIMGLLVLSGGCPPPPTDNDGSTNGQTDGSGTDGNGSTDDGSGSGDTGGGIEDIGDSGDDSGSSDSSSGSDADDGSSDGSGSGSDSGSSTSGDGTGGDGAGSSGGDDGDDGDDEPATTAPTAITLQQLAQTGDAVPGQPSGTTFTDFGNPVLDANGRVAFWALYDGSAANGYGGLYVWDATNGVQRALDDDPATAGVVPGRTTADYFGPFGGTYGIDPLEFDLAWGAGDRLLFVSEVTGEQDSAGIYRWRATDGDLVRVADREQAAALFSDASAGSFAPSFSLPGVSDSGIAVFGLSYAYFTQPPGAQFRQGEGVFTSNGTSVSILADTLTSEQSPGDVPDQGASAYYTSLDTETTLNASGDMLYQAQYTSGTGARGVYLGRNGSTYRVIDNRTSASWTGLPEGSIYRSAGGFAPMAMGPAGHIALDARLKIGDSTYDTVLLWNFDAGSWYELTGPEGEYATALLTGVNDDGRVVLLAGDIPYLVGGGTRTQLNTTLPTELQGATLSWTAGGGSINNDGRTVIAYTRDGGAAGLVFWTDEQLLLVADTTAGVPAGTTGVTTITDPRRDRPGRSGMLNDNNQMAFRVVRNEGGRAIYLAQAQ
ncbi:MAG: hypothetical protein KAY37_04870 [Phycisphaerae bacterium]|nr:hypothetical protein [Phycisphaerae bacterium]